MYFDPILLVITIFFAILGFAVSGRLKSVFKKYSKIPLKTGMTGKEVAEKMLRDHGIFDVNVISTEGSLTDHYNPSNKTVNLSQDVYHSNSISAAAVAAHECGHAVQHAEQYAPLNLRSKLVPIVNTSVKAMNFIYIAMIILAYSYSFLNVALWVIIIGQAFITLFSVITLPVEFDASKRALVWLEGARITDREGEQMATTALNWAASTYIVAALGAIATLLYYVMRFMGNDD